MDTSPEYIKMSEKAGEIQRGKHCPIMMGQKIVFWENDVFAQMNLASTNWKIVWLPRQDQLQDMALDNLKKLRISIDWYFGDQWRMIVSDDPLRMRVVHGKSFEQLWLAFVMKETFGKTWNGMDWVKDV